MKMITTANAVKQVLITTVMLVSFTFATGAQAAGGCGQGKIVEILEGGWNTDGFMIKIENPVASNLLYQGYVRFLATALDAERLRGIRSVAYLAMAGNKTVKAYSHTADCKGATQLGLLK